MASVRLSSSAHLLSFHSLLQRAPPSSCLHLKASPQGRSLASKFLSSNASFSTRSCKAFSQRKRAVPIQCGMVRKVSAKELDEILQQERKIPMVVDFYATWCGPCILLAQELEKLALEYHGQVDFLKVDTDEEHQLATELEIRGLPTMVFLSHKKEKTATKTEGLLPVETIKQIIADISA